MKHNIPKKSENNWKMSSRGLALLFSGYMSQLISQYCHYNVIVTSYFHDHRLEEDTTSRDVLLLSEKQTHEVTKKSLTETQGRNEELVKKIQDFDKHTLQLQLTVERSIIVPW